MPVLATVPAYATAQTQYSPDGVVSFDTQITDIYGSPAPFQGRLDLRFAENGTISGYFRPIDDNAYIPVVGGRTGNAVWFDIGNSGRLHFSGTLENGRIDGGGFQGTTEYKLVATPSR